jgi:hypothetical protein
VTEAGQIREGGRMLIGRSRELQELTAGILDAAAGTGGLFMVQGEPGIGKSRLVEAGAELSRADGIGGRERRTGSAAERARANVQRPLRDAVERITQHSPGVGKHLDWTLKTGMYCVYDPK